MRGILTIMILAGAFSAGAIAAFNAISARAERLEQVAAHEQMNRVAFSRRHGPRD